MFFVAEIGSNWCGSVDLAKRTIKACKEAGADAVKFQMWRSRDLYKEDYSKYELTFEKAREIKAYCDKIGIEFFCSVFYPEAVDFLEELGVKRYKIASRTCKGDDPFCHDILDRLVWNNNGKQIIYSNGFQRSITILADALELYCIPKYPANPGDINWTEINQYDGFSDHCLGIKEALNYARLYPDKIIEKHVKLEDNDSPDSFFSITTQELATLITLSTSSSDRLG